MNQPTKLSTLALLLLLVLPLGVETAQAEATTPSTPNFTISIVDYTYYVAPKSTTNPYTGETIQQGVGYTLENITVLLTIPNQPFSSSALPDGNVTELFYAVRFKGHFDKWGGSSEHVEYFVRTSSTDSTVAAFCKGWRGILPSEPNAQVDFQVKAVAGYNYTSRLPPPDYLVLGYAIASLAESDWSDTQTITLPSGTAQNNGASTTPPPSSSTQNPASTQTENPAQPQKPDTASAVTYDSDATIQTLILAVALVSGVLLVIFIVCFSHKTRQPKP